MVGIRTDIAAGYHIRQAHKVDMDEGSERLSYLIGITCKNHNNIHDFGVLDFKVVGNLNPIKNVGIGIKEIELKRYRG